MTDIEKVRAKWPEAHHKCNKNGTIHVIANGQFDKYGMPVYVSEICRSASDAWADAARKLETCDE